MAKPSLPPPLLAVAGFLLLGAALLFGVLFQPIANADAAPATVLAVDGAVDADQSPPSASTGPRQFDEVLADFTMTEARDRRGQKSGRDRPGKGNGRKTTTTEATTTSSSSSSTSSSTTTTAPPPPPPPPEDGPCTFDPGGSRDPVDFAALADAGRDANALNGKNSDTYLQSVYDLLVPAEMSYEDGGLRLRFDVADQPASGDWSNDQARSEIRTQQIDVAPVLGSTVAYCMEFTANHPDVHGPTTIFQAFSRAEDGPLLGIEMTGVNQFSNAVANELQVVTVDGRHRISNAQLRRDGQLNTLLVVLHYDTSGRGSYLVSLNGRTLRSASGLSTYSNQGVWWQFGLYAHGMKSGYGQDLENRQGQLASGATLFESTYRTVERVVYQPGERSNPSLLDGFGTRS